MTISKTLKDFEELLSDHGFLRIHQSHLVNIAHIKSLQKSDGGYVQMVDESIVPISRSKKHEIIALLKHNTSL